MFLGVEDKYGVPGVVDIEISGGVPGLVSLLVTGDFAHGIYGAVASTFPNLVSLGSTMSVPN